MNKKIVIGGIILLVIIPLYHYHFGIVYARKEYKIDRLDYNEWNLGTKTDDKNPYDFIEVIYFNIV